MSTARQLHALCLATWLRTVRTGRELTQEELATEVGLSPAVLSRIETGGRVDIHTLGLLAVALCTTLPELLQVANGLAHLAVRSAGGDLVGQACPEPEVLYARLGKRGVGMLAEVAAAARLTSAEHLSGGAPPPPTRRRK